MAGFPTLTSLPASRPQAVCQGYTTDISPGLLLCNSGSPGLTVCCFSPLVALLSRLLEWQTSERRYVASRLAFRRMVFPRSVVHFVRDFRRKADEEVKISQVHSKSKRSVNEGLIGPNGKMINAESVRRNMSRVRCVADLIVQRQRTSRAHTCSSLSKHLDSK